MIPNPDHKAPKRAPLNLKELGERHIWDYRLVGLWLGPSSCTAGTTNIGSIGTWPIFFQTSTLPSDTKRIWLRIQVCAYAAAIQAN